MVAYWIKTVFFMIASVGALLLGLDRLSKNVTKLAHKGLKKLFNKTSKYSIIGVGIGALVTVIMQSSAATTVMVVGFVNTGIMTLTQATSIIMGANIGTTITAQLAALNSFDFGAYVIVFCGIGVFITNLGKKEKTKTLGRTLSGLGLLFLGLKCMDLAINATFDGELVVKNAISNVLAGIDGSFAPVILFFLGIALTAAVQSSALITTVIITLTGAGIYIGAGGDATALNNNVLFLILGTNIGTCVTALISSIGAQTNARRASMIHLLFNLFGSIIFIIILIIFKDFMAATFGTWFASPATQIAMFHTVFNLLTTLIFLPFIKVFVKLSTLLVKDKDEKEDLSFTYMDERMIRSPSVAVHQVRKELSLLYMKAVQTLNVSMDAFLARDDSKREEVKNANNELDTMNERIMGYLVKLANSSFVVYEDECTVSIFHNVLSDILRIGEIGDNICKYTHQMIEDNLEFSDNVFLQLGFYRSKINSLFEKSDEVFLTKNIEKIKEVDIIEDQIDNMRKELISDHFERLARGECKNENSGVYVNLVNNLERAADHMTYIAQSVEAAKNQAIK